MHNTFSSTHKKNNKKTENKKKTSLKHVIDRNVFRLKSEFCKNKKNGNYLNHTGSNEFNLQIVWKYLFFYIFCLHKFLNTNVNGEHVELCCNNNNFLGGVGLSTINNPSHHFS